MQLFLVVRASQLSAGSILTIQKRRSMAMVGSKSM
jgi:hypothetical protein